MLGFKIQGMKLQWKIQPTYQIENSALRCRYTVHIIKGQVRL